MSCPCTAENQLSNYNSVNSVNSNNSVSTEQSNPGGELCRRSMQQCSSQAFHDSRHLSALPDGCTGQPLSIVEPLPSSVVSSERCCDENGCCALYPRGCRNPFWPHFAHPSWLCCRELYSQA